MSTRYEGGSYSIRVALSADQIGLQVGIPSRGSVAADSYVYYSVDWQSAVDDLVVALTPESGQPHLYVSCQEPFPNATTHTWHMDTRDTQLLRLNSSDATHDGCTLPGHVNQVRRYPRKSRETKSAPAA